MIAAWTRANGSSAILKILDEISVPGGPIYSVADMAGDPHFNARGLFEQAQVDGQPLKIPAILPRLSDTPVQPNGPGPKLGEHTDQVLSNLLGLNEAQRSALRTDKAI